MPDVYKDLTTQRVLTLEYVESFKLTDVARVDAEGLDRQLLAKRTADSFLTQVSLYKILFHDKALSSESIILLLTLPTCKAYPISILLHDHYAIHASPRNPPLCMSYTIGYW